MFHLKTWEVQNFKTLLKPKAFQWSWPLIMMIMVAITRLLHKPKALNNNMTFHDGDHTTATLTKSLVQWPWHFMKVTMWQLNLILFTLLSTSFLVSELWYICESLCPKLYEFWRDWWLSSFNFWFNQKSKEWFQRKLTSEWFQFNFQFPDTKKNKFYYVFSPLWANRK